MVRRAEAVSSTCTAARRGVAIGERTRIEAALRSCSELRAWLDAAEATLARATSQVASFPEAAIADVARCTLREAAATTERAATLEAAPPFDEALAAGTVTARHVDALTRAAGQLDDARRAELLGAAEQLAEVARSSTAERFARHVRRKAGELLGRDGAEARLERQRRLTSLRSWTDDDGMWNVRGRIDPELAPGLAAALDGRVRALFAERTPPTCPADAKRKHEHLRALALADLIVNGGGGVRHEVVVVVDADEVSADGGPAADWGLPVEVPASVLEALVERGARVAPVVVRRGAVLHAPGRLDLGRTTRLASRAQRRALRAMYAGCAIPGCDVRFDRCRIHHVRHWRDGGPTDLANLLPVCGRHHTRIHDGGWVVTLADDRSLTVGLPDGTVRRTGPPRRGGTDPPSSLANGPPGGEAAA